MVNFHQGPTTASSRTSNHERQNQSQENIHVCRHPERPKWSESQKIKKRLTVHWCEDGRLADHLSRIRAERQVTEWQAQRRPRSQSLLSCMNRYECKQCLKQWIDVPIYKIGSIKPVPIVVIYILYNFLPEIE
jgi:hypothetical protein